MTFHLEVMDNNSLLENKIQAYCEENKVDYSLISQTNDNYENDLKDLNVFELDTLLQSFEKPFKCVDGTGKDFNVGNSPLAEFIETTPQLTKDTQLADLLKNIESTKTSLDTLISKTREYFEDYLNRNHPSKVSNIDHYLEQEKEVVKKITLRRFEGKDKESI